VEITQKDFAQIVSLRFVNPILDGLFLWTLPEIWHGSSHIKGAFLNNDNDVSIL